MSSQLFDVFQEIEEILKKACFGIPMSHLYVLEETYERFFNKTPNYKSLGVNDFQELVAKLSEQKKVLLIEDPETNETHLLSVHLVELKRNGCLKTCVQELLDIHTEIEFRDFKDSFEAEYREEWSCHHYGFRDIDHLCDVLKDIVIVGVKASGEKVMKAVKKDDSSGEKVMNAVKKDYSGEKVIKAVKKDSSGEKVMKAVKKDSSGEKVKKDSSGKKAVKKDTSGEKVKKDSSGQKKVKKDSSGEKVMKAVKKDSSGSRKRKRNE